MNQYLDMSAINRRYKYESPVNVEEYLKAEKYINKISQEKVYYSTTAERRRYIIHRKTFDLKKVEDKQKFYTNLISEYLKNINTKLSFDKLTEENFVNSHSDQKIRKINKIVTDKKITVSFSNIEYDTIYKNLFELDLIKNKLTINYTILALVALEPLSLKSLVGRRQFKKYFKLTKKNIKRVIKNRVY